MRGADPLALGFITQETSSVAHHEAAAAINSRPMERAHLAERVSPDDLVGWRVVQGGDDTVTDGEQGECPEEATHVCDLPSRRRVHPVAVRQEP